jgi:hypothetical protein
MRGFMSVGTVVREVFLEFPVYIDVHHRSCRLLKEGQVKHSLSTRIPSARVTAIGVSATDGYFKSRPSFSPRQKPS